MGELEKLEAASAPDILARHLAALARRALRSVGSDDVGAQIELANRSANAIADTASESVDHDDLVAAARELMAVSRGRTPDCRRPTWVRRTCRGRRSATGWNGTCGSPPPSNRI